MAENTSKLNYSTMSKEELLNDMSNSLQANKVDYTKMSKEDLLNDMSNSLSGSTNNSVVPSKEDLLEEMSYSDKVNYKNTFTDGSLGTANQYSNKIKTFTSEIDDILSSNSFTEEGILKPTRNIKYGYLQSSAGFYNLLSNIPGGINRFSNFVQGETTKTPEELLLSDNEDDELNLLEKTEKYLKIIGLKVAPRGEADDGIIAKIYQGLGAAPITVGEYIPAIKGAGVVSKAITKTSGGKALNKINQKYGGTINPTSMGLAGTDFVMNADRGLGEATIAGAKGYILGNALKGVEGLNMKTRAITLGTLGFGSTEGSLEDRFAGGVTFSFLGALGNIGGRGTRDIVSDFKDMKRGVLEGRDSQKYTDFQNGFDTELKNQEKFIVDLVKKKDFLELEINNAVNAKKKGKEAIDDVAIKDLKKQVKDYEDLINVNKDFFETSKYLNFITKEKKDIRTSTEARIDLITKETYTNEKGEVKTKDKAKYEDIDSKTISSWLAKNTLPGKFMNKHPITKWIVDRTDTFRIKTENKFDTIVKGAAFTTKDFSLLPIKKDFSFVPALKIIEKVNSKDSFIEIAKTMTKEERIGSMQKGIEIEQRYIENPKDKIFDSKSGEIKINELKNSFDMNPKQQLYYIALRNMFKRTKNEVNGAIKESGLNAPLIGNMPNFLAHVFFGDYRVFANKIVDGKTQLVATYGATSKAKANALVKELSKIDKDIKFDIASKREVTQDPSSSFADALMYVKNDTAATQAINGAYLNWLKKNAPEYVMKRRKDTYIKGFAGTEPLFTKEQRLDSFERAALQFVEGGIHAAEKMRLNRDVQNFLDKDGTAINLYPNAHKVAKGYLDNAFSREKGTVSKFIDNMSESYLRGANGAELIGGINRFTLTTRLLAYNVKFIASQLIQPYQMIIPQIHRLNSMGGKGTAMGSVIDAYKEIFNPSKEGKEFIKYMTEQRLTEAKFLDEFRTDDIISKANIPFKNQVNPKTGKLKLFTKKKMFELATGTTLSAKTEIFSRTMAGFMFRKAFLDSGMSIRDANRNAAYMANKYMVEYNRYERPKVYGESGAFGYVGKAAGLFKTFQHNYLAQMVEHIQTAKKTGDVGGLASFTASMVFYAGAMGVVGIGAADLLVTKINEYAGTDIKTPSMHLVEFGLSDYALFGVPSTVMDFNLTSTIAAPTLTGDQLLSFPGLELVKNVTKSSIALVGKVIMGMANPLTSPSSFAKEALKVAKSAAPNSLHGLIELYYTNVHQGRPFYKFRDLFDDNKQTVMVIDMNQKDRGKYERDLDDWLKRLLLSTTTVSEARKLKEVYILTKMESNSSATMANFTAFAAHEYMRHGYVPQVYIDYMKSRGQTMDKIMLKIKNQIKKSNSSMLDRMNKGSLSPKKREFNKIINRVD
jgi:hypothetical protein